MLAIVRKVRRRLRHEFFSTRGRNRNMRVSSLMYPISAGTCQVFRLEILFDWIPLPADGRHKIFPEPIPSASYNPV